MVAAPHEDTDDEPVYSGHCRPAPDAPAQSLQLNTNYRFRVPDGETITFNDNNLGPQSFTAGSSPENDFGDFLIWRKDGLPSYQLACVVDDADTHITEVVRGADLLKSTARQILLQRALGQRSVGYFHTRLLRDEHGIRLAKRHDALALRTLREQGLTPTQVIARFAP
jgi:glutamyl-tRNA synthetase